MNVYVYAVTVNRWPDWCPDGWDRFYTDTNGPEDPAQERRGRPGGTRSHPRDVRRAGMTYTDRERADMKDLGFSPDKIADASPEWVADLDALARRADRSRCRHERAAYVDRGMAEMLRRIARAVRREQRKAAK